MIHLQRNKLHKCRNNKIQTQLRAAANLHSPIVPSSLSKVFSLRCLVHLKVVAAMLAAFLVRHLHLRQLVRL